MKNGAAGRPPRHLIRQPPLQTASTHACMAAQSVCTLHCGADSPGVRQSPLVHTTAAPHAQQSALVVHSCRQIALMQT
jgi:hypothetical protein